MNVKLPESPHRAGRAIRRRTGRVSAAGSVAIALAATILGWGVAHAETGVPPGLGYTSVFDDYTGYDADYELVGWREANDRVGPAAGAPGQDSPPEDGAAPAEAAAPAPAPTPPPTPPPAPAPEAATPSATPPSHGPAHGEDHHE